MSTLSEEIVAATHMGADDVKKDVRKRVGYLGRVFSGVGVYISIIAATNAAGSPLSPHPPPLNTPYQPTYKNVPVP